MSSYIVAWVEGEEGAIYNAVVKHAKPSQWSVDWLKNTRDAAKLIDIKSMKCNMNPTRLLVIGSVCKKDEEKNRTYHKEKPNRNICNSFVQIFGDCMHLKIHEGIFVLLYKQKQYWDKNNEKNYLKEQWKEIQTVENNTIC